MLLSQNPPFHVRHLPLDPLRVTVLPLIREQRRQIARTIQRVEILLSQYPPPPGALLTPSTSRWTRIRSGQRTSVASGSRDTAPDFPHS